MSPIHLLSTKGASVKRIVLLVSLIGLFVGAARADDPCPPLPATADHDEFKGITWVENINLRYADHLKCYFGVFDKTGTGPLRLYAELSDSSWVFATRIYLKVDEKVFTLEHPYSDWDRDSSGDGISESADIPLKGTEVARALAKATAIRMKFQGRHREKVYEVGSSTVCAARAAASLWLQARGKSAKQALALVAKMNEGIAANEAAAREKTAAIVRATHERLDAEAERAARSCESGSADPRQCVLSAATSEEAAWRAAIDLCQADPAVHDCSRAYTPESRPRVRRLVALAWREDADLVRQVCEAMGIGNYEPCRDPPPSPSMK